MDIYIEKENGEISLEEWIDYVKSDDELILAEVSEGINPFTKQVLRIEIPGRAIFNEEEINFKRGRVGCEYASDEMLIKLKAIGEAFGAKLYDCGEIID